ncbi:hypothetical protein GUJ93_ZPchr0010g8265 [Zizania palustris]|uniref:Uncharacterized protein n=1 Tax=Zizania palustris TaxID=103762 RepID=A0A8J5WED1_ZIZPA|nr:hypothetical protein GUJ93_ZPchr0010g8265 [Zizania palustris]
MHHLRLRGVVNKKKKKMKHNPVKNAAAGVVAKDDVVGSGDHNTIGEAARHPDSAGNRRYVIHIKSGSISSTYLLPGEGRGSRRNNVVLVAGDGLRWPPAGQSAIGGKQTRQARTAGHSRLVRLRATELASFPRFMINSQLVAYMHACIMSLQATAIEFMARASRRERHSGGQEKKKKQAVVVALSGPTPTARSGEVSATPFWPAGGRALGFRLPGYV